MADRTRLIVVPLITTRFFAIAAVMVVAGGDRTLRRPTAINKKGRKHFCFLPSDFCLELVELIGIEPTTS